VNLNTLVASSGGFMVQLTEQTSQSQSRKLLRAGWRRVGRGVTEGALMQLFENLDTQGGDGSNVVSPINEAVSSTFTATFFIDSQN
jgi:hypothetical protein